MKAIPTTYSGTSFRSRLEADFAAHFDALGLAWDYEPEGFELDNGMRYLPDFWLPQIRAWVEVKGEHEQRVDKFEAFAAQLWDEAPADQHGERTPYAFDAPLCVLAGTRPSPIRDHDRVVSLIGVRGRGSRYSVVMAPCPDCDVVNIIALWDAPCRACGHQHGYDEWADTYFGKTYTAEWPLRTLTRSPRNQWMPAR